MLPIAAYLIERPSVGYVRISAANERPHTCNPGEPSPSLSLSLSFVFSPPAMSDSHAAKCETSHNFAHFR